MRFVPLFLCLFLLTALASDPPSQDADNDDEPKLTNSWLLPFTDVMQWMPERQLQESSVFPGDDMIVTVSFRDIYKVILFMAVAWLMGSLSVFAGLPSLIGEIVAGFLLGPPLADFVPYPGALVLLGNIGLIGLMVEGGISLDLPQLKENGQRALLMATVGSALPLAAGFSVGLWIGQDVPSAVAAGAAFASSSFGVASNALRTGDVLNTPLGQMIVASSVFDDVFGLILLSILQVIADPESQTLDYAIPFISSFGYIFILGLLGVTILPRLIEERILPMAPETIRDQFAMVLLLLLVTAYMLMLNYSKASYLTGVFLAGLTFCKLRSVHVFFVKHGRPIHTWLLRVFFAATIGFQVPITRFQDPYVLKWGSAFLIATFAKIPIGFMAPRFKREIPQDFPYNPYYRDGIVTSLSMTCRGEFNVIVAAYALSQGLFVPDVYSAVMFAIMCGSIIAPLVLSKVLKYYNRLSLGYMKGKHRIERIGDTDDGYRPLFLAIQSRTPVHWNLHESFQRTLEEMGLVIIDHRSWHTRDRNGQNAVDITELFVQDTKMKVRIKHVFGKLTDSERLEDGIPGSVIEPTVDSVDEPSTKIVYVQGLGEERDIEERCLAIKEALSSLFKEHSSEEYAIQVSQWMAFVVDSTAPSSESSNNDEVISKKSARDRFYSFQSHAHEMAPDTEINGGHSSDGRSVDFEAVETPNNPRKPLLRRSSTVGSSGARRSSDILPALTSSDLWEFDEGCFNAAIQGDFLDDDGHVESGRQPMAGDMQQPATRHRRAVTFDASLLPCDEVEREITVFNDRLHGYVRQTSLQSP